MSVLWFWYTRIAVGIGSILISSLLDYGFDEAIAFADRNGYTINLIAPTTIRGRNVNVGRSAVCYDVYNHEPNGFFNRTIWAMPKQIVYFSKLNGLGSYSKIYHNWFNNGNQTDRIPLDIKSNSYRTFSRKEHLGTGQWIVTTEAPNGHLLDSKEFSIV